MRTYITGPSQPREQHNNSESFVHTSDLKLHSEYKDGRWLVILTHILMAGLLEGLLPSPLKTCWNVGVVLLIYSVCIHDINATNTTAHTE